MMLSNCPIIIQFVYIKNINDTYVWYRYFIVNDISCKYNMAIIMSVVVNSWCYGRDSSAGFPYMIDRLKPRLQSLGILRSSA